MPAVFVMAGDRRRLGAYRRTEPLAGNVDFVFAGQYMLARHRRRPADIGHDDGTAELGAIAGGGHLADRRAVAQDRLAAPGKGVGIVEGKDGETLARAYLALL